MSFENSYETKYIFLENTSCKCYIFNFIKTYLNFFQLTGYFYNISKQTS